MGSSSSKARGLLAVAQCKEMKLAPSSFIQYTQHIGDGILGYAGCLNALAVKMDKKAVAHMNDEERATFAQLEADKVKTVDIIKVFMLKEKMRFQLMGKEAKMQSNIKDLVRNVQADAHCQEITQMQDSIGDLQKRYKQFKSDLECNCKKDGRSKMASYKHIVKCLSTLSLVVFALGATVGILVSVANPAAATCIASALAATMVDELVFAAVLAAGVSGTILGCSLQKDEIDRAMEYMKNIQTNLQNLKEAMQDLEAENTIITETKELEHTLCIAAALEERCGHIAQICDEVSRSTFSG